MVKVELGCGKTKNEDYIGIDRYPLPGVDIVADLDKGIPLENDSVDVIFSSHALEHMESLLSTMEEIFRVCKHKAIVNILAPYSYTSMNASNFYHKQDFNEDTFRFFSDYETEFIDSSEYFTSHSPKWGLSRSDNSDANFEFEIINMEFYYTREYNWLSHDQKIRARKALNNVCDQIYYSVVVNKSGEKLTKDELEELKIKAEELTPPVVKAVRSMYTTTSEAESIFSDIIGMVEVKYRNEFECLKTAQIESIEEIDLRVVNNTHRLLEVNDEINKATSFSENISSQLEDSIKNTERKLQIVRNSYENEIERLEKQMTEVTSEITGLKNEILNLCSITEELTLKRESLLSIVLELGKMSEDRKKIFTHFYHFYKNQNLFSSIRALHLGFIDQLVLKNYGFNKNSLLCVSKTIPFSNYVEYKIEGAGKVINYFVIANKGARYFVEVVENGKIVFQQNKTLEIEGPQNIEVNTYITDAYLRLKMIDNKSVVRVLERIDKKGIFVKSHLAYFINE